MCKIHRFNEKTREIRVSRVVADYIDVVSAKSMTTSIPCLLSRRLRATILATTQTREFRKYLCEIEKVRKYLCSLFRCRMF